MKELFTNRLFVGALAFFVLMVGGNLLYRRHVEQQGARDLANTKERIKPLTQKAKQKPTAEVPVGDTSQGDEWHAAPHAPVDVSDISMPATVPLAFADGVHPTSVSSNPLFKDGVPEHLQCPPDLIGVYFRQISQDRIQALQRIGVEIIEKWNPNRPLTEVYPIFIEAERWYHANADPERAGIGWGGKRIDWQIQIVLDFPEIGVLAQEDTGCSMAIWRVELGHWHPDFNALTLADGSGRTFRTDSDKQYVFTWSSYIEKEAGFTLHTFTHKSGPANGDPNAEVIEINLDEIMDEELERLSGWNYNINPYTTGAYKLGDNR